MGSLAEEFEQRAVWWGVRRASWWYRQQVAGVAVREVWGRVTGRTPEGGGGSILSSLLQDLKFAWRAVRHAPGPHLVALLTVALGVGANAAMFSVVSGVVLSPLPYPDRDRLVSVWPEKRWSARMLADVRERTESFDRIAGTMAAQLTLVDEGEPEILVSRQVTGGWLDALGARATVGRLLRAEDEIAAEGPVAVLSHAFWRRAFGGDPSVVGRTVGLSGNGIERRTIVGVLEDGFGAYPEESDVWIPWITEPGVEGYRATYGGAVIATLASGASAERAIAEMRSLIPELRTVHPTQFRDIRFSPIDVVPLWESMVRGVRAQLFTLLGAVAFVLLIACTNVANLLLARATRRRREIGLRLALGANRGRILRQMLTESLLLGLLGGAAGVGLAFVATPAMRGRLGAYLPRAELISLDLEVVGYAAAISLAAGLFFGVVPGWRSAREDPGAVLGEYARSSSAGRGTGRINDALVVAEVALSLVLVVGAGLMIKSLRTLSEVDPGFDPDGIVALGVVLPSGRYDDTDSRRALFRDVIDRLHAIPAVGAGNVATVNSVPLSGGWSGVPYQVRGQEVAEGESVVGGIRIVSAPYFGLMGIELLEGRLFDDTDVSEAPDVAIVNRAFVNRHWPGETAISQVLLDTQGNEMATIVGVVADTRFAGLADPPVPSMYFPADQSGWATSQLLIRTQLQDPLDVVEAVEASIREVDPNLPVRTPELMSDVVADAVGNQRFYAQLFGGFGALALLLGLVGIYGVMSCAVGQRTREVGVRLALGATGASVLAETMQRGMAPVMIGVVIGLAGAYGVSRFLDVLLYEVTATDPGVYGGVAALVIVTGASAILVPAWRAMRQDPVAALRTE